MHAFSVHLQMDEIMPHLHIDFVPFATNSKRGLDTRVSLKQAPAEQYSLAVLVVIPSEANGYVRRKNNFQM